MDELAPFTFTAPDHPQPFGRVDRDLEPTVVLARRDVAAVHRQLTPVLPDPHAQAIPPVAVLDVRPRLGEGRSALNDAPRLLRTEGSGPRDEANGLEQGRLPLSVASVEDVQTRLQLHLDLT